MQQSIYTLSQLYEHKSTQSPYKLADGSKNTVNLTISSPTVGRKIITIHKILIVYKLKSFRPVTVRLLQ